jgi:uncharacterized membrane protein
MVIQPGRFDRYQRPKVGSGYSLPEKIVSAAVYIPVGFFIGIIYILAKGPGCDAPFFRFHFYQAVFLSILFFVIQGTLGALADFFTGFIRLLAPVIGGETAAFLAQNNFMMTMMFQIPLFLLCIYAGVMALMGKTTNIPWVSNLINRNMSGR